VEGYAALARAYELAGGVSVATGSTGPTGPGPIGEPR